MHKRHLSIYLNRQMSIKHHMSYRRFYRYAHTSSHRFQPTLWAIRLASAYRCVRHSMEVFPPGWKGRSIATSTQPRSRLSTREWVGAAYTPEEARTPQQKEVLALSDTLLAELEQADEYVFGVPMHNFGVPSVLKLWIDQIARVGKTFSYADGEPKGLIAARRRRSSSRPAGSMMRRRRWLLSILSSRICGRSLASSA